MDLTFELCPSLPLKLTHSQEWSPTGCSLQPCPPHYTPHLCHTRVNDQLCSGICHLKESRLTHEVNTITAIKTGAQYQWWYKVNEHFLQGCHGFSWIIIFTSRAWLAATSHRSPVIIMQPHLATANPILQPASPAALFMSTNQDPSSSVLATLPVTSLPWPDPACFPTALTRVYANACSLGLTMLGQGLLPEPELGAFLTCTNQPRHPPSGVQRTATC